MPEEQTPMTSGCEILTLDEMYRADRAAMAAGVAGVRLMENAGAAVASRVMALAGPGARVTVLCGPGNNGGDGFVAARHLRTQGYPVRLALLGSPDRLGGDAACHAAVWGGDIETLDPACLDDAEVAVDALFGAGLTRPLEGAPARVVERLNASGIPVVAVDVPSGIGGDTGEVVGELAVQASATVTFFRPKPGHLLYPGRAHGGRLAVIDIGIPEGVLADIAPRQARNDPKLWRDAWPWRAADTHKYRHGHAVVFGGDTATGAARLGARAALRTGAGLVTVAVPETALAIYAADCASVITQPLAPADALDDLLADARKSAFLIGPGAGVTETTRARVGTLVADGRPLVLDADALTVLARADRMPPLHEHTVITPHEGEFARLFPDLVGDKLTRARAAAARLGCVVVLKGPDTVVAAPDGRTTVADNAPPELATAGSGDVLAGIVLGALAQGVSAVDAARAGVWLLGRAAQDGGPGLISADLPERLPMALAAMRGSDAFP